MDNPTKSYKMGIFLLVHFLYYLFKTGRLSEVFDVRHILADNIIHWMSFILSLVAFGGVFVSGYVVMLSDIVLIWKAFIFGSCALTLVVLWFITLLLLQDYEFTLDHLYEKYRKEEGFPCKIINRY